jgi:hypothetical protein
MLSQADGNFYFVASSSFLRIVLENGVTETIYIQPRTIYPELSLLVEFNFLQLDENDNTHLSKRKVVARYCIAVTE